MTRWLLLKLSVLGAVSALLMGGTFTCNVTFIPPAKKESTETQTAAVPAGAIVKIENDNGSTRVTVDPTATEATIRITKTAIASTTEAAEALLAQMEVTVTPAAAPDNTLLIKAVSPPAATSDTSQIQFTFNDDDEVSVTALLSDTQVAQYRLQITLPPAHAVNVTQLAGPIRAIELDTASTLTASAGSIRSIRAQADVTASAQAGSVTIEAHRGSANVTVGAGSVSLQIVSLAATDEAQVRVDAGNISLQLPKDVQADLMALTQVGFVHFHEQDFDATSEIARNSGYVGGKLNGGGATVDVRSDVGTIEIDSF
ncbi:MAG: hypothetical protein KA354_15050 [Phycisphaerae bacterium]|nr:hypothetical protein [Phycisphaerae bacterium]